MFQKCPVCNGSGRLWMALYQALPLCGTCNGHGIISEITGMPPVGIKDNASVVYSSTTEPVKFPKISDEQKKKEIADILKRTEELTKKS